MKKITVDTNKTNWGSTIALLNKSKLDGTLEIGIYTCDPGKSLERHNHGDAAEWCYILSGEADFDCGNEIIHAVPGDLVYLPAHSNHTSHPTTDEAFTSVYIVCKDN